MKRCDYTYLVDGNVLFIEDLNMGRMSVTNGIEDVLEEISKDLDSNGMRALREHHVIYRDSDGMIDGVKTSDGKYMRFYHIQETDLHAAKLKIQ